MDKLRLINYRCFDDTGDVELRPITLLLGANSSGKSSFIKFFPLLQQSVGTTVNGLFLWDGQYVDFKDFKNTVKDGKGEITIEYVIDKLPVSSMFSNHITVIDNVLITLTLEEKDIFYDYLKKLVISYNGVKVEYLFDKLGKYCRVKANTVSSDDFEKEMIEVGFDNNLLPSLRFTYRNNGLGLACPTSLYSSREILKLKGEKDTSDPFKLFDVELEKNLVLEKDKIYSQFAETIKNISKEDLARITDIRIYQQSGTLLNAVNGYFNSMAENFSYVLPLRAIMNRYYRFQNRAVDQIDPDGDNLAMYLNSLSDDKKKAFNKWLDSTFHFEIGVKKSEGHVEMIIHEGLRKDRNLVDVGFGYTQILPILTIIWKSIYDSGKHRSRMDNMMPITIAIEQPELHLHPRFQAYFANMLAKVITECKKRKLKIRIIIETHSEVIVNRIGLLIANNASELKAEDVNVVLFDPQDAESSTNVRSTTYSDDGFLVDWPYGFLSDEDVY